MKRNTITIFKSFKQMEEAAIEQDLSLTPEKRLSIVEFLRDQVYLIKGKGYENKQRLQRTIKISKRK